MEEAKQLAILIEQPWNDDRLKIGNRFIGCITKENADYIMLLQKKVSELENGK